MTADLAASCAALAALLPIAQALTAQPDVDGTTGHGQQESRPPWNQAAASAVMDAHAGVRDRELAMRLEAGLPARIRGGSDANTFAAIAAIEVLSSADVSDAAITEAAWFLDGLCRPIEELPAVDQEERPRKIPGECPYCHGTMLWAYPRAGTVTCLRFRACVGDANGQHPVGHMEISRLTADPIVRWADGLVAP